MDNEIKKMTDKRYFYLKKQKTIIKRDIKKYKDELIKAECFRYFTEYLMENDFGFIEKIPFYDGFKKFTSKKYSISAQKFKVMIAEYCHIHNLFYLVKEDYKLPSKTVIDKKTGKPKLTTHYIISE